VGVKENVGKWEIDFMGLYYLGGIALLKKKK
jgi:hypothetical protein